jgi:transcriptional regulator NrdR family protein
MENVTLHNGDKPTVEDVLTKVNGLWWMVDMFVVLARTDISYEPPVTSYTKIKESVRQYFVYEKILNDLYYALNNREVLNRSFETFRSLYGDGAKLEFTGDEILNRALRRLLVDQASMNNPFEFQDALEGIVRAVRRIHRDITRELNEYEFKKLEESLKKSGNL